MKQLWRTQRNKRLHPDLEAVRRLFHEHCLVLVVTQAGEVTIVSPVEELAARIGALAGEHVTLVVTVEVHLEGFARRRRSPSGACS